MVQEAPISGDQIAVSKKIGARLIDAGIINERQLELALQEQARTGGYLTKLLQELGFAQETDCLEFMARGAGAETVDLRQLLVSPETLARVPYEIAKRTRAMPVDLNEESGEIKVAIPDPTDVIAIDSLENATGLRVIPVVAADHQIDDAIFHYYEKQGSVQSLIDEIVHNANKPAARVSVEDAPIIQLVEMILGRASELGASDIHIEPEEKILRVRMRVDGILHQELLVPKALQPAITARFKIIGRLNLTEHRIPQDGRTTYAIGNREISLRISTLPTSFGENIVLRLLDGGNLKLNLNSLGFSTKDLEAFKGVLAQPHGVILITGPTGSGKTTTLYSALNSVCGLDRSIFTLEDPIEYRLPIIRQTQVCEEVGMTFAMGLRALLRQDPDVILVGETRDTETAQLMIRAALTGHLVFSTLHTNSAVESIPRLIDMAVEPYLLPASLNAVVAQRLVRRICDNCRGEGDAVGESCAKIGYTVPQGAPERFQRGEGCASCNGTGYRGRLPLYEVLIIDDEFHAPIVKGGGSDEVFRLARSRGMTTLFEDGMTKALDGRTTFEEILRVTPPSPRDLRK